MNINYHSRDHMIAFNRYCTTWMLYRAYCMRGVVETSIQHEVKPSTALNSRPHPNAINPVWVVIAGSDFDLIWLNT